jgi:hypothetical protein
MTELDELIQTAYANPGRQEDVNKVYLALIRSLLVVPVVANGWRPGLGNMPKKCSMWKFLAVM